MRTERDLKNQMAYIRETSLEEGILKGREEGKEEGREEERARIIEELRKQGYPEEKIAKLISKD